MHQSAMWVDLLIVHFLAFFWYSVHTLQVPNAPFVVPNSILITRLGAVRWFSCQSPLSRVFWTSGSPPPYDLAEMAGGKGIINPTRRNNNIERFTIPCAPGDGDPQALSSCNMSSPAPFQKAYFLLPGNLLYSAFASSSQFSHSSFPCKIPHLPFCMLYLCFKLLVSFIIVFNLATFSLFFLSVRLNGELLQCGPNPCKLLSLILLYGGSH
jgi:hypothetical protein